MVGEFSELPARCKFICVTKSCSNSAICRRLDHSYDELITSTVFTKVSPKTVTPEALKQIRTVLPDVQELDLTKARLEMIKFDEWQHLTDSNYRMDKSLLDSLSQFQNLKRITISCFNIRRVADLKLLKLEKPYSINLVRFNEWRIPELYDLLLDKPENLQQIDIFVSLNAANSIQLINFLQAHNSPVKLELAVSNAYFERQFVELENLCSKSDHLVSLFWRPRPINPQALADIMKQNKEFKTLTFELFYEYQDWVEKLRKHTVLQQLGKMSNLGFNVHSGLRSFVDLMEMGLSNIRRLSFRMGSLQGMVAKEALKGLVNLKNLNMLELRGGLVKQDQLEAISQVQCLKELDLEVSQTNTWFDRQIAQMTQLTRLRIYVKFGDKIFDGISQLKNLQVLDYSTDKILVDLEILKSMQNLQSLMLLKVSWKVWNKSEKYLDDWRNLKTLDAFIQSDPRINFVDLGLHKMRQRLVEKHPKLVSLKLHVV
eukprot:TRINITY_DN3877_c0_g1_i5.p1 TRINITY_DN3877_c0_g1~~TRINITY_DN3877_c0_g1_i5.p1  ORF type:complete len:522 (+),score=63.72 TRINITY_DN3877_c0_g1_i5:110-1567(+)